MTDLTPAVLDPKGLEVAEEAHIDCDRNACNDAACNGFMCRSSIRAYLSAATPSPAPDDEALCAFLTEAAGYFEGRPTGGEDKAHWANVTNAENCKRAAARLRSMAGDLAEALREQEEADKISNMILSWAASHGDEPDLLVSEWSNERTRAEAAEAKLKAMGEALEPFAREADNWADDVPDDYRSLCFEPGAKNAHPGSETAFTVGDLRRARRATGGK